eukprot:gnl/TRDRNA2_/TRDRNA2_129081_c0_seq1.p1 gnl/TRDRNA2_/TRDRNA2_129081_c0~~gnl/TRDRNA2_/TRDRNA2_129081_c0_seq1.p1  ORF type:complete len:781 (-),score=150.34 gnl/TRDRNA2_/TRDRNA2_129081_c0_seq1:55-2304(-)
MGPGGQMVSPGGILLSPGGAAAAASDASSEDAGVWQEVPDMSEAHDSEMSGAWHQYLKGEVHRERREHAEIQKRLAEAEQRRRAMQQADAQSRSYSPPRPEIFAYEKKMLQLTDQANRRAIIEAKGLPVPEELLSDSERRCKAKEAQARNPDGGCTVGRAGSSSSVDRTPTTSAVDVAHVAAQVAGAFWARESPSFRVSEVVSEYEFVVEPVADPVWRSRVVRNPDAAVEGFWPSSAERIFNAEMRKDLFWHVACGTSSSCKAACALASVLARCAEGGLELRAGGRLVRNVAVCSARLARVPGTRTIVDSVSQCRRPSGCAKSAETWSADMLQRCGIETANDEPLPGIDQEEAGMPYWWVAVYVEEGTSVPVAAGQLVRVGGSQGQLARIIAADHLHCSIEERDGRVRRVPRCDCQCVARRMLHLDLLGPAHGSFTYTRAQLAECECNVPLNSFETPELLHGEPESDGAPFLLSGFDRAPRFLKTAKHVTALPALHYVTSSQAARAMSDFASIVERIVQDRVREARVLRPSTAAKQLLSYEEVRQEACGAGRGEVKERERALKGAGVQSMMRMGRIPWHLSEDPDVLDGLKWLFEVGWFDGLEHEAGKHSQEYKDFRQYYEDYILYTNHPMWKRTVDVAKKLDKRYYAVAAGARPPLADEAAALLQEFQADTSLNEYWKHLVARRYVVYPLGNGDACKLYARVLEDEIERKKESTMQFLRWKQQQLVTWRLALQKTSKAGQPRRGYGAR